MIDFFSTDCPQLYMQLVKMVFKVMVKHSYGSISRLSICKGCWCALSIVLKKQMTGFIS